MPQIDDNIERWNAPSSWSWQGEEWSGPWAGSEPQWWGTLFPRLHTFLPAGTVLELGPGHGRWTQYLQHHCEQLVLVDLAANCLEACRQRFGDAANIRYMLNDGKAFPDVPDTSVDLVFSFDSLVHAEADVLESYVHEFARTLRRDGIGFIHHSNMGNYRRQAQLARAVPPRIRKLLTVRGAVINLYAWRAETPTAELFAKYCSEAGLMCIAQERIAWEFGRYLTDVISVLTPVGSRWARPNVCLDNPQFMVEARLVAQTSRLYSLGGFSAFQS